MHGDILMLVCAQAKYDYSGKLLEEGITIDDIFEEVPIRIHNSALVSSLPPHRYPNRAVFLP